MSRRSFAIGGFPSRQEACERYGERSDVVVNSLLLNCVSQ
jgi:hypothetical protein